MIPGDTHRAGRGPHAAFDPTRVFGGAGISQDGVHLKVGDRVILDSGRTGVVGEHRDTRSLTFIPDDTGEPESLDSQQARYLP